MFDREGLQYLTDNRRNKQDPFAVIRFLKNDSFSEYINQGAIESAVIQTIACEPIVSIVSIAGGKAYYSIKPPRVNGALSNVSEANSRFPLVFSSLSLFSLFNLPARDFVGRSIRLLLAKQGQALDSFLIHDGSTMVCVRNWNVYRSFPIASKVERDWLPSIFLSALPIPVKTVVLSVSFCCSPRSPRRIVIVSVL